jgi:hypothetical protein
VQRTDLLHSDVLPPCVVVDTADLAVPEPDVRSGRASSNPLALLKSEC